MDLFTHIQIQGVTLKCKTRKVYSGFYRRTNKQNANQNYKNNKMYISGGIQYMSPDDWAKVGIISEVLPENLYASCIKEFNWAPRS